MKGRFHFLKTLPPVLKVSWLVLVFGAVGLVLGYLTAWGWMSFVGLGLLFLGPLIAFFNMRSRREEQELGAGFYTGILVAPVVGFLVFILLLLAVAVVILLDWFLGKGFSGRGVMHVLHLGGVLVGVLMVAVIPPLTFRVRKECQLKAVEQDEETNRGR